MMKKITFCAYDKPDSVGGPVTWLQLLLPALKSKGFEVECLILFHVGNTGPLYEHLTKKGIVCKTTPFQTYSEDNIKWILSCLHENPPQIFVPNLVVPAYFAAGWAKKAGIFTVGVSHSDDPFYHAIQKEFIDGLDFFRLNGMVGVSNELEKQLNNSVYAAQVQIKRIPYGVHIPTQKSQRKNNILRVVFVGRLAEEQKRISEVAKAFCALTRQIPNTEALFYGDGPDKKNVETILAMEGEGLPVRIVGNIPSEKVQEQLLQSHVIVLLSDYEGLPIAVLEAMACGVVPVCLTMRSGITEQIKNGETGFIVKNRTDDFIRAIRILKEDMDRWETISTNAKELISNNFSMDLCHNSWADYFNSLVINDTIHQLSIPSLPSKFHLPPVHPDLARADKRTPKPLSIWQRNYKKLRFKLGAVKQKIVGNQIF